MSYIIDKMLFLNWVFFFFSNLCSFKVPKCCYSSIFWSSNIHSVGKLSNWLRLQSVLFLVVVVFLFGYSIEKIKVASPLVLVVKCNQLRIHMQQLIYESNSESSTKKINVIRSNWILGLVLTLKKRIFHTMRKHYNF